MKNRMNSYERVLCALQHRKPDRPPLHWVSSQDVTEALQRYTGCEDEEALLASIGIDFRRFDAEVDKAQPVPAEVRDRFGSEKNLEVSYYGVVLLRSDEFPQGHRVHGPFYEATDLDAFDWPEAGDVVLAPAIARKISSLNKAGICTLTGCDNPFKIAYFMRPFEDFMVDCVVQPDFALELMRRIARVEMARAGAALRAGARAAMIFGDFAHQTNLMISPECFRRILKPVLAEYTAGLKAINPDILLILHSDGNLTDVLDDLIECGFDAVHPIQPESMDMVAVKKRYGDRLTLFGGISVQSELPFLTAQEIRSLIRSRVDTLGENGGFMFAPSNTMLADIPLENILAAYGEAAR